MGGEDSEIGPETTNVLLEAAAWNFINIRRSASKLGIHSEAAFRFSRGVHPSQAILGAKRAAELLRRLAGGTVAKGIIDTYPNPPDEVVVRLDPEYVRRLSGLDLGMAEIAELLQRLEFAVELHEDHLIVTTPDHRLDIEGPHDLVEEICRMYGYDRIPSTILADALPPQRGNYALEQEERIKDVLVELGLQEVITYRLTSPAREALLFPGAPPDDRPYVTITNPNSPERSVMRHSLLASVLEVAAANSRYQEHIALFEIGPVYLVDEDETLPREPSYLAVVMTGARSKPHWQNGDVALMDFFDLKGVVEALFCDLHLDIHFEAASHPAYRPGRSARILLGESQIGLAGELHPLVVEGFEVRTEEDQPVLAAELDLEAVIPSIPQAYPFQPISPYPAVREDLAVVVDKAITAAAVKNVIERAGGYLLQEVELFDVYEGKPVPAGQRSLAYHLTFQSPNKTLTDREVRKNRQRIIQQLNRELGAKVRE